MTEPTPRSSPASEALTLGWSEPDGEPSPSPRSTPTPAPSSPSDGRESPTSGASLISLQDARAMDKAQNGRGWSDEGVAYTVDGTGAQAIGLLHPSGPVASPAKTSASPASDADSPASDPASPSPSSGLWNDTDLRGSSWRTFPASSTPTAAEISPAFSGGYPNSGMAWRGESSTLAITAWRSDEGEYSSWPRVTLADVLEPTAPPRFFLSPRAAAGILRRAAKRGRELPAALMDALGRLSAHYQPEFTASPMASKSSCKDTSGSSTPSVPAPDTTDTPLREATDRTTSSSPVLLTMREGKDGGGKGPLLSENQSLTLGTSPTQTLFDGPQVRRLTPVETERLMGWPDGWTIVKSWPQRSTRAATPAGSEPNPENISPPEEAA